MVAKDHHPKTKGSTKPEVGEIDTSAPFQSVRDAVSLFGEGTFRGNKPVIKKANPQFAQGVLRRERELQMVQNELSRFKEQLQIAENTKVHALPELERAKQTVDDLSQKIKYTNESKDSAVRTADEAERRAKQFAEGNTVNVSSKTDLETARLQYVSLGSEIDAAKKELRKIQQECDASVETKHAAIQRATEAENATKENIVKVSVLSGDVYHIWDSVKQVKFAITRVKDEENKICSDKDKQEHLFRARHKEATQELLVLMDNIGPEQTNKLKTQLGETMSEIETLQNKMNSATVSDLDCLKIITSELNGARELLRKLEEEESSLRSLVESLKLEVSDIKTKLSEMKEKEAETESAAGNLQAKLQRARFELEAALSEEGKVRSAHDKIISTIEQIAMEQEKTKIEAEDMNRNLRDLKTVTETTRIALGEAEKTLGVTIQEAEEAKTAEATVMGQIRLLSEKTDTERISNSRPRAQITISKDEFESLSQQVSEFARFAEMEVTSAMSQVEVANASESEALKRLEITQKDIEDTKVATEQALKKAEMAEAAKKVAEGELRRWQEQEQEQEQEKAAEAELQILAETEPSFQLPPEIQQIETQHPQFNAVQSRKLKKAKTSVARKTLLTNLSGVFHKKKIPR